MIILMFKRLESCRLNEIKGEYFIIDIITLRCQDSVGIRSDLWVIPLIPFMLHG